ncbi:hypothetical protein N748_14855 [Legionella pneumophila str. 121004]|nr:hypothetical protein N748_14855 [Legionella pneumophila str. 121004]ERH43212.1 hypothetical protein N751_01665 [Legionella pneumophila str. Leg01/11]ERH44546.1 hypothetical protein N750_08855 [Legionella pneumophila str. Leg01/53]ERI48445.1 hypothetical protein N749_09575 [Legionella pneumophila str. Leg01/20]
MWVDYMMLIIHPFQIPGNESDTDTCQELAGEIQ